MLSRSSAGLLSGLAFLALAVPTARADAPAASCMPMSCGANGAPVLPGMAGLVAPLLSQVVSIATVSYAIKTPTPPTGSQTTSSPAAYEATQTVGSGFIIDAGGLIVTNQHVINDGARITVTLSDNTKLKATVLAQDTVIDVALLSINAGRPLTPVRWGNSDTLEPGDRVLAIGNPLGLGESVSSGIVSALDRDIHTSPYDAYIQTDAAINHGNSGGALYNTAGEVIGMNTALISAKGETGSVGLGFAIPGSDVQFVVGEMRKYGRVRPGWLGADLQQVSSDLADGLGLSKPGGAVVLAVQPNSPAARAGLRYADVILGYDGKPITELRMLNRDIGRTPLDSTVPMTIWRNRSELTVPVTIVENPDSVSAAATAAPVMPPHMARADMGLSVAPITDALRRQFGLSESDTGLVIDSVLPNSVGAERDIAPGAVIERVDEREVQNLDELHASMHDAWQRKREHMLVLLKEKNRLRLVALPTFDKME